MDGTVDQGISRIGTFQIKARSIRERGSEEADPEVRPV